jgi:hypothetical protein
LKIAVFCHFAKIAQEKGHGQGLPIPPGFSYNLMARAIPVVQQDGRLT